MEIFETTICDAKLNSTQLEKHVEHIHGGNIACARNERIHTCEKPCSCQYFKK
jgi:hypothetical protein